MTHAIGQLIAYLIGYTAVAAAISLIAALILQLVCKIAVEFKPPYGMAYKAAFLGLVASILVNFAVGLVIGTSWQTTVVAASGQEITVDPTPFVLAIIPFFVSAAIYVRLIKHPETGAIGFSKACLVSLMQLILGILLIVGFAIVADLIARV